MKINKVQNNINFQSGLTKNIVQMEKTIQPGRVAASLKKSHNRDWADLYTLEFKKNKALALACKLCENIFLQFRNKHDYRSHCTIQDMILPHGIYVFNEDELQKPPTDGNHYFFTTIKSTKDITKSKKFFDYQTVFLNNMFKSLEEINEQMNMNKENNSLSTGHFLHCFIHEWIHAIEGKMLYHITHYKSFGYYDNTVGYYGAQKLSEKENEIVADILGEYATKQDENTHQYTEAFAEAWTKFICDSLNKECTGFKKDPVSELKKTPKEFREILKKVSTITPVGIWGSAKDDKPLVSWNNKWDK